MLFFPPAPQPHTPPLNTGTPDFASSAALLSNAPGPRDDLEALGYSLVELALGDLPW